MNEQQKIKDKPLIKELKAQNFIIEEPYFENSLLHIKVSQICHLLVILEQELIDQLVIEIPQKYKEGILETNAFNAFMDTFTNKFIPKIQQKIKDKIQQQQQQIETHQQNPKSLQITESDLIQLLGKYMIRNLKSDNDSIKIDSNIFEYIQLFYDKYYLESFQTDEDDEVDFVGMCIEHRYIYDLYNKIKMYHKKVQIKNKQQEEIKKKQENNDKNNKNLNLLNFIMDKKELNGNININQNAPQIRLIENESDDDEDGRI